MPHSSTQRRRMVTAFLRRGSMPAHAMSREGCLRARSAKALFWPSIETAASPRARPKSSTSITVVLMPSASILRNSSSPSGSHSVGNGELLRGQLLTAVAADVDTEVRGEGVPEWLREPLALHQVVVRVDDDGHETAGSLP